MSTSANRLPRLLCQRRKGKANSAYCNVNGKRVYLGVYGSAESKAAYAELIAQLEAQQAERLPVSADPILDEVIYAYLTRMRAYCKADSLQQNTGEFGEVKRTMSRLRVQAGSLRASEYGPKMLKAYREARLATGCKRLTINKCVRRVVAMFKWAAAEEMISVDIFQALQTVEPLKRGRSEAGESVPVRPVEQADIDATLDKLMPVVADMVRVQVLTGMRPSEVCKMQPGCIDRTGDVWRYTLPEHKTAYRGHSRVVAIGPKAQAVLLKYLARGDDDFLFTTRRGKPYDANLYRQIVERAAKKAHVAKWTPNRLRHTAATEIRRECGLDSAQVALGHRQADVTQVYAEADFEKAAQAARKLG